jgi:hypothetical protein
MEIITSNRMIHPIISILFLIGSNIDKCWREIPPFPSDMGNMKVARYSLSIREKILKLNEFSSRF